MFSPRKIECDAVDHKPDASVCQLVAGKATPVNDDAVASIVSAEGRSDIGARRDVGRMEIGVPPTETVWMLTPGAVPPVKWLLVAFRPRRSLRA